MSGYPDHNCKQEQISYNSYKQLGNLNIVLYDIKELPAFKALFSRADPGILEREFICIKGVKLVDFTSFFLNILMEMK